MKPKTAVTTGDIAKHCQVSSVAVINWVKSGKLKAYTTPGGHRRVAIDHFRAFLRAYDMPPFKEGVPARWKILVVDDDLEVANIIVKFLSRTNRYEMATAGDGFAAGIQTMKFCPDLVVLDLMMPQLDGFQVCKMLKSAPETAHIKVLVLTGYASEENVRKALECGADYCMAKPIKGNELKEKVEEFLKNTRGISLSA